MRRSLILIGILMVLPSFGSAGPDAMTSEEARHLISRTGFGAAPHEIAAMTGKPYAQGVAEILEGLRTEPVTAMPAWADGWLYPHDLVWTLGQTQSELFNTNRWFELTELSGWWLSEMAITPSPLTERMVLFWNDHFANSFEAHENSQWLAAQNRFLRAHAAGDFAMLARGMLLDPAMLEYLDNVSNVAGAPNENLGREFLELFTLGEGRGYTQDDVRAAARMLTGYTINDTTGALLFEAGEHDGGSKSIFGQTGRFDADDLVRLTLAQPDFGTFIVEKLWKTFISDTPDADEVARLTAQWRANDLAIEPLLEAMFLSEAFWDQANRGRLVKSPVDLIVGTTRSLGLSLPKAQDMVWMVAELDQALFLPPNVAGWPDGVEWINDATASARATMLSYLIWGAEDGGGDAAPMMMAAPPIAVVTNTKPDDLRIGQVFATYVEEREPGEGLGGTFTLFDVGFGGHNWRSITFWMEYNEADDFTALYAYQGDCGGTCLTSFPHDDDDDGWVAMAPWDGMLDEFPDISPTDRAFMAALGAHLPALIGTTQTHVPFGVDPYDPDHVAADMVPFLAAARLFAKDTAAEVGRSNADLVFAFSQPNALGLAGANMIGEMGDLEAYTEAREEASIGRFAAARLYGSGQAWLDAIPGSGPDGLRAAKTLFAVAPVMPDQSEGLRAPDPDALLMQLVLSPEYQVK